MIVTVSNNTDFLLLGAARPKTVAVENNNLLGLGAS